MVSIRDRAGPGARPGCFLYPESRLGHFLPFLGVSWVWVFSGTIGLWPRSINQSPEPRNRSRPIPGLFKNLDL